MWAIRIISNSEYTEGLSSKSDGYLNFEKKRKKNIPLY
jgi:hypothetical protein